MITIKKWFITWWKRINECLWSQLFTCTSIIQAIIGIVLTIRVYQRNYDISTELEKYGTTCQSLGSVERMERIVGENLFFIIFQIFQLFFCLDAL
nr:1423_t:CDS:2 [Entrophospora candida]